VPATKKNDVALRLELSQLEFFDFIDFWLMTLAGFSLLILFQCSFITESYFEHRIRSRLF